MKKSIKQSFTLGATVIAATAATNAVHADEVKPTETTTPTEAVTTTNPTVTESKSIEETKALVDDAKQKAEVTEKAVAEQETVVKTAESEVTAKQEAVKTATEKETAVKEAAAKATPEEIAKATKDIETKENDVKSAEDTVTKAENDVKDATKTEDAARKAVTDAKTKVAAEETKLTDAKGAVDKAAAELEATNPASAKKAVEDATNEVKRLESKKTVAENELTKATEADKDRQAKIDEAKSALDAERTEKNVPALEQSLENAKSLVATKTSELEALKAQDAVAQTELEKAEKELADAKAAYATLFAKFEQDRKLRAIVIPEEYAKHDIKDYQWFMDNAEKFMALQPKGMSYQTKPIGSNAEKLDLANLTDAQRREIAEFVVQMMNDLQSQYWSQREPGKTITPIKLTDEAQALAKQVTDEYSQYYAENGGTPDKFDFAKNWGHLHQILTKYHVGESLGGLLPTWHAENMGGYTMLTLKYDIASNIRNMMFTDGDQANGHAKHLISAKGTGVSVSTGTVNIINIPASTMDTSTQVSTYANTDADANNALKKQAGVDESAVQKAQVKKAATAQAVTAGKAALKDAESAQTEAQRQLNAAQNAIAKAQKAYDDALAVKEQVPAAKDFLNTTINELKSAQETLQSAEATLSNLEAVRTQRQTALQDAKTKLLAQEKELESALKQAIATESDLKSKGQLTKDAQAKVVTTKQALEAAKQSVVNAKEYLEVLKNAPAKVAEAERALSDAKLELEKAKATLETEIAKLETLKLQNKAAQEDYKRVFTAYQKLVEAKRIEENLRREQERLRQESVKRTEEGTHQKATKTTDENNRQKQTRLRGESSPIQIQTRTVSVERKVEGKQNERQLPSTGESANAFGFIGLALAAMGLAGLKRKRESK